MGLKSVGIPLSSSLQGHLCGILAFLTKTSIENLKSFVIKIDKDTSDTSLAISGNLLDGDPK
jgi:hypothetical protein